MAVLIEEISELQSGDRKLLSNYKKLIRECKVSTQEPLYDGLDKASTDMMLRSCISCLLYLEAIQSKINTDYIFEDIFNICKTGIENELR